MAFLLHQAISNQLTADGPSFAPNRAVVLTRLETCVITVWHHFNRIGEKDALLTPLYQFDGRNAQVPE